MALTLSVAKASFSRPTSYRFFAAEISSLLAARDVLNAVISSR